MKKLRLFFLMLGFLGTCTYTYANVENCIPSTIPVKIISVRSSDSEHSYELGAMPWYRFSSQGDAWIGDIHTFSDTDARMRFSLALTAYIADDKVCYKCTIGSKTRYAFVGEMDVVNSDQTTC